jgi:hypothetical protein
MSNIVDTGFKNLAHGFELLFFGGTQTLEEEILATYDEMCEDSQESLAKVKPLIENNERRDRASQE